MAFPSQPSAESLLQPNPHAHSVSIEVTLQPKARAFEGELVAVQGAIGFRRREEVGCGGQGRSLIHI